SRRETNCRTSPPVSPRPETTKRSPLGRPFAAPRRRTTHMPQNITGAGRRAHSIAETCALTGLGRDTVYTAIRDGHLVARKLGRRPLITDDDRCHFLAGLPRAGGKEQAK